MPPGITRPQAKKQNTSATMSRFGGEWRWNHDNEEKGSRLNSMSSADIQRLSLSKSSCRGVTETLHYHGKKILKTDLTLMAL